MKRIYFNTCLLIFISLFNSCVGSKSIHSGKEEYGTIELVVTPYVGEKPLYLDSLYRSPDGQDYFIKSLRFFLSDIALARSTGKENVAFSETNKTGVYLVDFNKPDFDAGYGKQSCKVSFKVKPGAYSDIRFTVGIPRELNHGDPATAPEPLNLGQAAEMYWEWNSGYIFFLAEGEVHSSENKLFHFAIGNDSRIMPFSFGDLFEITPLVNIEKGKTTQVRFALDINKLFINGDQSIYSLKHNDKRIVHGGHNASILRDNLLKTFSFRESKIED